jgi:hypothetical protein
MGHQLRAPSRSARRVGTSSVASSKLIPSLGGPDEESLPRTLVGTVESTPLFTSAAQINAALVPAPSINSEREDGGDDDPHR